MYISVFIWRYPFGGESQNFACQTWNLGCKAWSNLKMDRITLRTLVSPPQIKPCLCVCMCMHVFYSCGPYVCMHGRNLLSSLCDLCLVLFTVFSLLPFVSIFHLGFSLYLTDDYPSCSIHSFWYVCKLASTVLFYLTISCLFSIHKTLSEFYNIFWFK